MNTTSDSMRILVTDDEENIRTVVSRALAKDGHGVTEAVSGEQAMEAFVMQPFPLVITDVKMGGMSGIDLLKRIKQISPDTQVVIMTSSESPEDTALTAMRAGAYDCLIKPFEEVEVISNVARRAIEKIRLTEENRGLLVKLKQKNEELEYADKALRELSIRDGLTGLYNHRYFQETIASEIFRSRRYSRVFSLLFMDLDFFKKYNDKKGHPEGDKLLITLSRMLLENLRTSDFVARYGGEEFVMILPETPKINAFGVADEIRGKIADYPFDGREVLPQGKVTVSIGVATYPEDGSDVSSLILFADQALYQAKRQGRNRVS
jgi:diguanylate cyclase (GGDEF)-like protein